MNGLSVLKLFQCSNGDLKFSEHAYSIYKVRKPRMTELGQGVGVRAHYPTGYPIEKYVGWTDMSSYFIFNNSYVCPHFIKPYNYLNILPRNQ